MATTDIDDRRFLPTLAFTGAVCFRCYKFEISGAHLLKCGKCRRVSYCSTACQKADWKRHKPFCNAMHQLLHDGSQATSFDGQNGGDVSPAAVTQRLAHRVENESAYIQQVLGRSLTPVETNILAWEPCCATCSITDRLINLSAGQDIPNRAIRPCSECALVFYCCESHWDLLKETHTTTPSQDSVGEFSQCQLNQWFRENEAFSISSSNSPDTDESGPFRWFPKRIKTVHDSLQDKNWWTVKEDYINLMNLPEALSQKERDVRFRAVTEALSIPMTILFALEVLNEGDASWERKTTLTIHVLGSPEYNASNNEMFEEILHLAPGIKTLKIVFIDVGYRHLPSPIVLNSLKPVPICSSCDKASKKLFHEFRDSTYHSYMQERAYRFVKPDLCIAFHPRISPENMAGWALTVEFMKKRQVPTVLTAYTRSNANVEHDFLQSSGVKLIDTLSLRLNPFGALTCRSEPHAVPGFIAANLWLSGAFKS